MVAPTPFASVVTTVLVDPTVYCMTMRGGRPVTEKAAALLTLTLAGNFATGT